MPGARGLEQIPVSRYHPPADSMGSQETKVSDSEISISLTANLQLVRPLRHFLTALCTLAKYSEEERDTLALVVTEVLNNSIEHGCSEPADEVKLSFVVQPECFQLEVSDAGRGGPKFAETALERANVMPGLEEPRGRGLYLIRSYMDVMEVTFTEDAGTRVFISKTRTP